MKTIEIKYSVIVPVFNCALFLERCINSIIKQQYNNFELILVNDGSTDNSGNICNDYSAIDSRIIVINKKNAGVSCARNDGLNIARGKYIIFLDSDDYLDDGYFDEINNILSSYNNVELINFGFYSDVDDINGTNISSDIINYNTNYYSSIVDIRNDFVSLWDHTMLYNIWNKVYLKSIIDENDISFPSSYWGEDVEFNRRYLDCTSNMYNSEKCFYHYIREREGATTKKYKSDIFELRKKEFTNFNDYFEKWNIQKSEYYEFSCRRYIERVLGCIENIYCSNFSFSDRFKEIKNIINDDVTRETLIYAKPRSSKIKIMLIPIRLKFCLLTMLMGKTLNVFKNEYPDLFNKLKNRR